MQRYRVSADHVHPDWRFIDHPVEVHTTIGERGTEFYADAERLGCGKNFRDQIGAIRYLFLTNACTNIRIRAETPEEEEKADGEIHRS